MKIKVGDKVYDGAEEPVMVILTNQDKKNIADMHPDCTKYAMIPVLFTKEQAEEWMDLGGVMKKRIGGVFLHEN